MKAVFDTNVLIDGFADPLNAASRLLDAVADGELEALATHAVKQEYRLILDRHIKDETYEDRIDSFLCMVDVVQPADATVVLDDPEDYKFIQAAVGGKAEFIISSDRHLLDIGEIGDVKIITPIEAWAKFEDSAAGGASAWQSFVTGLGIGR